MTEAEAVEVAYRAIGPGAQPTAHLRWMPTQESAGAAQTEMVLCQLWKGPLGVIWLPVPDYKPDEIMEDADHGGGQAQPVPSRLELAAPLKNWHVCHGCTDSGFPHETHYHGEVWELDKVNRVMVIAGTEPDKDGLFRSGHRYFRLDPP